MIEQFRIDGKVAVITGAGGGIGRAVVGLFREAGATVIAVDRTSESIADLVDQADLVALDVADPAAIEVGFAGIVERHGGIDVLVNNAGVAYRTPTIDLESSRWDEVIAVNLRAPALCARLAARSMMTRGGGAIINVASQLGITPTGERAAYVASKSGLIGMTKSLALEWVSQGIRVNAVAPGVTSTPMIRYLEENQEAGDQFRARIPIGRFGRPEEIALACLYLASPASSYVIGQTLVVDGGYSVP